MKDESRQRKARVWFAKLQQRAAEKVRVKSYTRESRAVFRSVLHQQLALESVEFHLGAGEEAEVLGLLRVPVLAARCGERPVLIQPGNQDVHAASSGREFIGCVIERLRLHGGKIMDK